MGRTREGTGFQSTDTSRESAEAVDQRGRGSVLRDKVLSLLKSGIAGMTTEEIAQASGEDYKSIQPRLSELKEKGLVEDSGRRGITRFGKKCIVWRVRVKQREFDLG